MAFSAWFRVDDATWPWNREMGQKRLHFHGPDLRGAPLPVEEDEAPDPVDVGLLGADAVVQPADDCRAPDRPAWVGPEPGPDPEAVHVVFPYGGGNGVRHG